MYVIMLIQTMEEFKVAGKRLYLIPETGKRTRLVPMHQRTAQRFPVSALIYNVLDVYEEILLLIRDTGIEINEEENEEDYTRQYMPTSRFLDGNVPGVSVKQYGFPFPIEHVKEGGMLAYARASIKYTLQQLQHPSTFEFCERVKNEIYGGKTELCMLIETLSFAEILTHVERSPKSVCIAVVKPEMIKGLIHLGMFQ